jgi:hypothetical protein
MVTPWATDYDTTETEMRSIALDKCSYRHSLKYGDKQNMSVLRLEVLLQTQDVRSWTGCQVLGVPGGDVGNGPTHVH